MWRESQPPRRYGRSPPRGPPPAGGAPPPWPAGRGPPPRAYAAYTKAIDLSHDNAERRFLVRARDDPNGQL